MRFLLEEFRKAVKQCPAIDLGGTRPWDTGEILVKYCNTGHWWDNTGEILVRYWWDSEILLEKCCGAVSSRWPWRHQAERYWRDTREIDTGEILVRYWRDTGEILVRYCNTGVVLVRYCRDTWEMLWSSVQPLTLAAPGREVLYWWDAGEILLGLYCWFVEILKYLWNNGERYCNTGEVQGRYWRSSAVLPSPFLAFRSTRRSISDWRR